MSKARRYSFFHSISFTLLLWFLLISLIPLGIVSFISYKESTAALRQASVKELKKSLTLYKGYVESWFHSRELDIESWSCQKQHINFLTELRREFAKSGLSLEEYIKSASYNAVASKNQEDIIMLGEIYEYVHDIFLIDTKGNIFYTVGHESDLGTNLLYGAYSTTRFANAYRKTIRDRRLHFSDFERYKPSNNKLAAFLTAPMFDENGDLVGVFAVQLKLGKVLTYLSENLRKESDFIHYIIGSDGYLRSAIQSQEEILTARIDEERLKRLEVSSALKPYRVYSSLSDAEVIEIFDTITYIDTHWYIISEVSVDRIFAPVKRLQGRIVWIVIVISLLTLFIAYLIAGQITKPIKSLSEISEQVAEGRRDVRVDFDLKNELGTLARSFNKMLYSLQQKEQELYRISKESEEAKERALEAAKVKTEFLASMSHEIRTPINGVIGMLELIADTPLDDVQRHQIHLARSSADALLSLINDILDYSKIEANKIELEHIDIDIHELLGDFSESIAIKAQEKGVEVILDMAHMRYKKIKTDPTRLKQILTNLVGNAIKFTDEGHVLIRVEMVEDVRSILRISIEDTGIGIPDEKLDTLFESFSQVDASTTRKYGGTGLGLAIAKNLSRQMGGDLYVRSVYGEGSVFTFEIAVTITDKKNIVKPSYDLHDKSILIVDKNELTCKVIAKMFAGWGVNVTSMPELEFENCKALCGEYDLLLVDSAQKKLYRLADTVRNEADCADAKLVMMCALSELSSASKIDLIDGYFPKPATTKDLLYAIDILVGKADRRKDSLRYRKIVFTETRKVLLVEDNQTNQIVAEGILSRMGISVDIAQNGKEALQMLEKASYALVLMDVQMPVMDGFAATEAIRMGAAGARNRAIPIIAMTANAMDGDKERCLRVGMDNYISKPIDSVRLQTLLSEYLSYEEQDEEDTSQSVTQKEMPHERVKRMQDGPSETVIWSEDDALARLGGSKKILQKVITVFLEDIDDEYEKLCDAIEKHNEKDAKLHAHSIKGSSANVGALALSAHARTMEMAAKEGDMPYLQSSLEKLDELVQKSRSVLQEYIKN